MLDAARAGLASRMLISAGAGVGKSALLEAMAAQAHGATVLRTAGLESESPLAFAALHRLLRPVMDRATSLPEPQARALHVAFGQDDGDRIDPFLVALATLSLLTEVAEAGPVLCLIDDAHWLDVASSEALLFAARRLLAEPVVIVFAARDDDPRSFAPTDVPLMRLQGLSGPASGALLRERADHDLSDQVVHQLAARTGGNPLALMELPGRLNTAQLEGTAALPDELPLSDRVERAFLDRCRRLSETGQTLMLLAAADDTGRLSVLLRAGEALGVPPATVHEVEPTQLLEVDGDSVRVRHPLVRSAVYQAATGSERRHVHAALADALTASVDRDRRTWHRAAACDGPDEGVAAELEAAGSRAERRGGHYSASEAYQRAARLTSRDELRARRLFSAARTSYAAGTIDRAGALLDEVRLIADDPLVRADIDRLRGRIQVVLGSAADAHSMFIRAARGVAEQDQERAVEMAALAGVLRSHGADSGSTLPAGVVVTGVTASDSVRIQCLKLLLQSTTLDAERDWGGALKVLRTALTIGLDTEDRDVWANLANIALHLGDDAAHRRYFSAMLSAARADGAVMEVLYALHRVCLSEFAAGDWSAVRRSADDAMALARSIGQPALTTTPLAWLTLLAALGGAEDYDALLNETEEALAQRRLGIMERPVADLLHWAKGTRAQHAGAASESSHHFDQMRVPVLTRLAASARISAAVQAKEHSLASDWTSEIEAFAVATALPWALAVAEHGRALLAGADDVPGLYERALIHHAQAGRRYEEACTQLAYGEHLRRAGRRVEARRHLTKALETFRDLRAEPLVARATRELRASGATARQRNPSTLVALTPTELHIAQLVSHGMSNKDVAAQCWISPRTVAFHLRNVFTKTGVTSRGELAQLDLG
ncbi:DNA-binding transcriptional regulator, CsgD family [Nocardioides psychrotolerans]|uniref:DNA-binding transcriptional regulator, CsgD family n=2 Tax=Nocardioides psychrotolerans TaxID=1005945 RepID=A0A1I3ES97_9ACTN|nr:DNA-binding transcriptional regulator, CsgD family [Nocardioides psychrotolerans]